MKITSIILSLASLAVLSACDEHTVLPDRMGEPVKVTDVVVEDISLIAPNSDGSFVVAVNMGSDSTVALAHVGSKGVISVSQPVRHYGWLQMYSNASEEYLLTSYYVDNEEYQTVRSVQKFDRDLTLELNTSVNRDYITLLDNGDVASFDTDYDNFKLLMHIVGNSFTYYLGDIFMFDHVLPFEDMVMLYSYSGEFKIYFTDGTYYCGGSLADYGYLESVRYADGSLYFVVSVRSIDNMSPHNWRIIKTGIDGTPQFVCELVSEVMSNNFSVTGDTLITTGFYPSDYAEKYGCGVIYLIDNNNGKLIRTIPMKYSGCYIMPFYVSADRKGGYNVYAVRRNYFDESTSFLIGNSYSGPLYIYHTADLNNLQINNR